MSQAPPTWTFVLTQLDGTVLGELTNAGPSQVTLPLNRLPTCTFPIPLAHPLANYVIGQDCLVKVYRWDAISAKQLVFVGPVLSAEEQADRDIQTISVNAVGPFWRLSKRLLGVDKNGISFGVLSTIEITALVKAIVDAVNGVGYTGIDTGAGTFTPNTPPNNTKIGYPTPITLGNPAEIIAQLAASVNGFDYEVAPREPVTSGFVNPTIGTINALPIIGATQSDVIFEYGQGSANMTGYSRVVTRENMMTRGYITAPSWPDSTAQELIMRDNSIEIANRGLFEDSVSDGGVSDNTARTAMLDEHIKYRAAPREIINITLAQNAKPWVFANWKVGDTVRARATVRGSIRFDAMFRIWAASFSIDKNGNEVVDLELVMPL